MHRILKCERKVGMHPSCVFMALEVLIKSYFEALLGQLKLCCLNETVKAAIREITTESERLR